MTDIKTNFLDVHRRVIYKSARGAFYIKDASGKKHYGIKARYIATSASRSRKVTTVNTIPNKIKPKIARMASASPKARKTVASSRLALRLKTIAFTFKPHVGDYDMRAEALKWYKSMASDIEAAGEVKILSIIPYETNKLIVRFRFQPAWAMHRGFKSMPREIKSAIERIMDPDDDGNYPIMVKGEPEHVSGSSPHIISIG